MKKLPVATLFVALAAVCYAGMTLEQAMSDEDLIREHYPLVLVIHVVSIASDAENTNADPPVITGVVEEVIKGEIDEEELVAVWRPPDHDVDWVGEGATEALQRWELQKLDPPAEGSTWITAGSMDEANTRFMISWKVRYPFTPEKLEDIRRILGVP